MSDYKEAEEEKVEFAKEILYTQGELAASFGLQRLADLTLVFQPSCVESSAAVVTCLRT
jgi:hypothetical protein